MTSEQRESILDSIRNLKSALDKAGGHFMIEHEKIRIDTIGEKNPRYLNELRVTHIETEVIE